MAFPRLLLGAHDLRDLVHRGDGKRNLPVGGSDRNGGNVEHDLAIAAANLEIPDS